VPASLGAVAVIAVAAWRLGLVAAWVR
jgi:hypothetical protein